MLGNDPFVNGFRTRPSSYQTVPPRISPPTSPQLSSQHQTAVLPKPYVPGLFDKMECLQKDLSRSQQENWPKSGSDWLRPVPWGLRRLLNWVDKEYGKPIYITENGVSTADVFDLSDSTRITFYGAYINEVLKATILDGVDVRGYFAWSLMLMDNFEWASGYTQRFGLHYVNFNDPDRPRTQKESARFFAGLAAYNGFEESGASSLTSSYLITLVLLMLYIVQ